MGDEARRAVHHVVEGRSPPPFLRKCLAGPRGDRDGEITRLQRRAYDRLKDNLEELTLEDRRILNDPDFPWGAGALPSAEDISKHTGIPLARIVDIRRGYR